ncbi:MAG: S41 family peptidase [Bacteroidota bacterium]
MKQKLLIPLLALLAFTSCEEVFFTEGASTDPVVVFEAAWAELRDGYSFFEVKQIDWDSVYDVYRPRVQENLSEEELFQVIADMIFTLRDGHVNLVTPFDVSRNWTWYLDFPPNFDGTVVERSYWQGQEHRTGPFIHLEIAPEIAYIRYASFAQSWSPAQLHYLLTHYQNTKGIILDVRDNFGGNLDNTFSLASQFADQERLVYQYRYKSGPGVNEFGDWRDYMLAPADTAVYTNPVVVLTNRSCYSACNAFVTIMDAYPHVTLMGDTTGGGAGIPVTHEMPNGWYLRYSGTQTIDLEGHQTELGVYPDVGVMLDVQLLQEGRDSMIEEAISFLE